jgi:hypothetical protein
MGPLVLSPGGNSDIVVNPCLPKGYQEHPAFLEGRGVAMRGGSDFTQCVKLYAPLLEKSANRWCDKVHDGQCSFAGVYQPPLPKEGPHGHFYAFSQYRHLWAFLQLKDTSSLAEVRAPHHPIIVHTLDYTPALTIYIPMYTYAHPVYMYTHNAYT